MRLGCFSCGNRFVKLSLRFFNPIQEIRHFFKLQLRRSFDFPSLLIFHRSFDRYSIDSSEQFGSTSFQGRRLPRRLGHVVRRLRCGVRRNQSQ